MWNFFVILFFLPVVCIADPIENGKDFNAIYDLFKDYPSKILEDKGNDLFNANETDSAFVCFTIISGRYLNNMSIAEKQRCARAYNICGLINLFSSNYSKAYTNFLKALKICEESGYDSLSPTIYSNISSIFGIYGDKERAGEYFKKAYDQSLKNENWPNVLEILLNLTSLYFPMDSLENIEGRMREFKRMKDIPHDDLYNYTLLICNGMLNVLDGDYEQAIDNFKESIAYTNDSSWMSARYLYGSYSKIAKAYTLTNRYDSAISYIKKGKQIAYKHNIPDMKVIAYNTLADYYEKAGEKENALAYKSRYLHLSDSIFNAKGFGQIKDMQSLYEIEKIEIRLHQLTAQQKLKDRILAITLAALTMIALLLSWVYRQNRRLAEKNKKLFSKNMEIMDSEEAEKQMRKEYENKVKAYEELLQEDHQEMPTSLTDDEPKYRSSVLSEEDKTHLLGIVRRIMDDPQVFCSADFTIEKLALLAESKHKYISQVINEKLNKNFNTFLNEYRISEARKRLMDFENYGNLTIEAIAESIGFKSRGNFNQTFKKITGLTPTEYQKMAKSSLDGFRKFTAETES